MIARRLRWARTPVERAKGLLRAAPLDRSEALVIERARQVHTFGMRYPIDVCFCDRDWRVLHVVRAMAPRRATKWVPRARFAVETRAGVLGAARPGDQLLLVDCSDR